MSKMNFGNKMIGKFIGMITDALCNHTATVTYINIVLNKYKFFICYASHFHSQCCCFLLGL
jgi:hypothetical protein